MPAKPITIGSLNFAKRGDANAFLRTMLNRYDIGDRVSAADEDVLRAALALLGRVTRYRSFWRP
jgi:hypothetical protein